MDPHEPKRQRHLRPECRHRGSERTYGRRRGRRRAQGKKRRAKRQKVIAHNASVVTYLANIDVRDAGGSCYSQRDKVVSYGIHAHAGHARLEFGSWLLEKDNLRRATGVALAVGRKRLPPKFRCFPRMSGQVLRDKVFCSMSTRSTHHWRWHLL